MPMNRPIGVILKSISEMPEDLRQDALAAQFNNKSLVLSLKYVFDPAVEFDLPGPGVPDGSYRPNPLPDQDTNLYQEFRRMYLFLKGGNPNLKEVRRQALWFQLLEYVHPEDALYLIGMKDKTMIYPGITYELVQRTFPGLLPERKDLTKLSKENKVEGVIEPEQTLTREKINPLLKNNAKMYTCPEGCTSVNNGDSYFSKGNLTNHLKAKHGWNMTQIVKEQHQQDILRQARNG